MPLKSLDVHLTNKCNMNCLHCLYRSGEKNIKETLDLSNYNKIFKDLFILSNKDGYINFLGGEPLLRKNFWEIAKKAKKNHLKINLISNLHFPDRVIKKIFNFGFDRISIGIHGKEKTHDWLRNSNGDHKNALMILKNLSETINPPHINITTVLHNKNLNEVKTLLELGKKMKINSYTFLFFSPVGRGLNHKKLTINPIKWNSTKNKIIKWIIKNKPGFVIALEKPYQQNNEKTHKFCSKTNNTSLEIRCDGNVYFCGLLSSINGPSLGNLKNNSIIDIYKSIKPLCSKNLCDCIAFKIALKKQDDSLFKSKKWILTCPYKIEYLN